MREGLIPVLLVFIVKSEIVTFAYDRRRVIRLIREVDFSLTRISLYIPIFLLFQCARSHVYHSLAHKIQ